MNDSQHPFGYAIQWDEYAQWLKQFHVKAEVPNAHAWDEWDKLRERMNEIEKALVGAGAK